MLFLISVLVAVGLSHLIVDGQIFDSWRAKLIENYGTKYPWLPKLLGCYQCAGFWSGVFVGLFLQPVSWGFFNYFWWWVALILSIPFSLIITPFFVGCATSYVSMAAATLLNWLDAPAMAVAVQKAAQKNESTKT